jgi:hypothetical protein
MFLDINNNNKPELIVATDISANKKIRPVTSDGGYLYAFRTEAVSSKSKKINFRDIKKSLWRNEVDQVLYSSPVAADVMSSNLGPEIIIASGCFFPQNSSEKRGRWIKIFDEQSGNLLRTLETPACSSGSPAVADLDGDGTAEIIAFVQGAEHNGGLGSSTLIAWNAESGEELWRNIPRSGSRNDEIAGEYNTPVIGDLDGNGSLEIVVNNGNGLVIVDSLSGITLSCEEKVCEDKPSLLFSSTSNSSPTIADINLDGQLELIAGAGNGVHVWSGFQGSLNSSSSSLPTYSAPWPTWRGNAQRTGNNNFKD